MTEDRETTTELFGRYLALVADKPESSAWPTEQESVRVFGKVVEYRFSIF